MFVFDADLRNLESIWWRNLIRSCSA